MDRIAIIGSPGSGKSTLARRVGEILGIPVYHLDRLYWNPGWEPTPGERWRKIHRRLLEKPRWIIDGHYASTLGERLSAADALFYLDFPRVLCLRRTISRALRGHREDMADGCPEKFDADFLSFLAYVWNFPGRDGRSVEDLLRRTRPGLRVHRLRSPREVEDFLEGLDVPPRRD